MTHLSPSCPGCESNSLHLQEEHSRPVWVCRHCRTWILMDGRGLISTYSMDIHCNGKAYRAYFYPYPKDGERAFVLFCMDSLPHRVVVGFNFIPQINAKNFQEKLKTLLTFG